MDGAADAAAGAGAAAAAGAGSAANTDANTDADADNSNNSDESDEDENVSLSLGNQSKSQSQISGSSNLTQVASTIVNAQASRTWAPTGFFTTGTPTQNSSIPVSNMTITSCSTCTTCPGFQVNVAPPPSNSSTNSASNEDDEDEDDDDEDDEDGADGSSKRRALAGRFFHQKREDAIVRDFVGSSSGNSIGGAMSLRIQGSPLIVSILY